LLSNNIIFRRNRFTTTGLQLWLDAALPSTVIRDGLDKVSQWNDKSGRGRNCVQATAAAQPTFQATGIAGLPAVNFDGVDDFLPFSDQTLSYIASSSFTVIYVASKPANANTYVIGGTNSGTRNNLIAGYVSSNTFKFGFGNDDQNAIVPVGTVGTPEIYTLVYSNADNSRRVRRNGTDVAVGASSGGLTSMTGQVIGRYSAAFGSFKLGELLIYNRALTVGEYISIERDLISKWAIS
jgi:hypothetical protein